MTDKAATDTPHFSARQAFAKRSAPEPLAMEHASVERPADDDADDGVGEQKAPFPGGHRATRGGTPPLLSPRGGRVTLRTLIFIRWIAIGGQLITVLTVALFFQFPLPVGPVLAAIGASAVLNLTATVQGGRQRLTDFDATLYLAYDTLQLTVLLYLTGGLLNPFAVLLLAPVTVGATVLTLHRVMLLVGLTLACLSVLALWHLPLPWPGGAAPPFDPLYKLGGWVALSLSSAFIAAYTFRVAQEARYIADALGATQMALAREQRLSALGALAAAAAHELGTPLGTIAVVAKELSRDIPADDPLSEDIALLQSQTARCRQILADLARKPETDGGAPYDHLPLRTLVEAAAAPHRVGGVRLDVRVIDLSNTPEPVVRRQPEILHGLGNLLQNAMQFARRRVTVNVAWDLRLVSIAIVDDGPGFPSQVLSRIGEPYLSQRSDRAGHMGLGIFIAQTLLERTGAAVKFTNTRGGGARVVLRWDRDNLEAPHSGQNGDVA